MENKLRINLGGSFKSCSHGPQMFMSRLVSELQKTYPIEFTSKKPHLSLGVIFRHKSKGSKTIVRIDGCYYNKAVGNMSMNKIIAKSITKSDGVIYQSEFSKRLCKKLLRAKARKSAVIYNGVDQSWVSKILPVHLQEKYIFVSAASWRNSKRPKSIIKAFIDANIPDSRLLIIGKFDKMVKHAQISYLGNQSGDAVVSYLKSATCLVHLCKIESCPNIVIEALSCGLPVVCNNIGGSPEIVGNDGVIVNVDPSFKFRYINEKNVDNVDTSIIVQGMIDCINRKWSINRPDLNISVAAQKYYSFFLDVLNNN